MKMKKIGLLLVGALFTASVFAQTKKQPEIEAKEELKVPISEEMASIQTAFQLAEYGATKMALLHLCFVPLRF